MPIDYTKGRIYKILCNKTLLCYIGSTTQSLSQRLSEHKQGFLKWKKGLTGYITSFDIISNEDYTISLVEDFPCKSKYELEQREKYWVQSLDCINKNVPTRSRREYYDENKDKIKDYNKRYYEENKEYFHQKRILNYNNNKDKQKDYSKCYREDRLEYYKQQVQCECGGKFTNDNKSRHMKSKIHKKYLDSIIK